ncbi:TetR/AcrR family transcriptional regulator [Jeotgalibaca dankookensis]|uniref:TetR/AcrR family transcriptional regulator n=1 Tax=Jeotgalibaca dankookensis TaxID=708126 RepID=UPI0007819DFD|nr:TetR/AcrR family transcriptional regulator [Jeotgalibaca dankookensis]
MENNLSNHKEVILSQAKKIAVSDGISKINIRTVAKNSGIAIGTVYNYFPSKGDLLISVVTEFWDEAFTDLEGITSTSSNFFDNLEKIYRVLDDYLHHFKENWLNQLALLKADEKVMARKKEEEYFQKVHDKLILLIDRDPDLQDYPWSEVISKEKMAEFIFDHMLIILKKEKGDLTFFIALLKQILINKNRTV